MNRMIPFLFLMFFPLIANSAVFKIGEFKGGRDNSLYLDLGVSSNSTGHYRNAPSFAQILSSLSILEQNSLNVRIQGFPMEAMNEMTTYYENKMPNEFKIAKASKGNINNPALAPLAENLEDAIKSTSYYKELASELEKIGYKKCALWREKFELYMGKPSVAEISLDCKRL